MIVRGRGYRRIADGLRLRYVTDHPGGTLRRTALLRKIGQKQARRARSRVLVRMCGPQLVARRCVVDAKV